MIYFGGALLVFIFLFSSEVSLNQDNGSYDDLFKKFADYYGLDWKMLRAIAQIESSNGQARSVQNGLKNPNDVEGSKSSDGLSWGLMQVTLPTAQDYDKSATPQKLNDPEYSVKIAARHLSFLKTQFNQNDSRFTEWVVKSYNQGQGNTKKEIAGGPSYANGYWLKYINAYAGI